METIEGIVQLLKVKPTDGSNLKESSGWVLLEDDKFIILHNVNYPYDKGNGFLEVKAPNMMKFGRVDVVGCYEQNPGDGKHYCNMTKNHIPGTENEVFNGPFNTMDEAIACLWLNRHLYEGNLS